MKFNRPSVAVKDVVIRGKYDIVSSDGACLSYFGLYGQGSVEGMMIDRCSL